MLAKRLRPELKLELHLELSPAAPSAAGKEKPGNIAIIVSYRGKFSSRFREKFQRWEISLF